MDETGVVRSNYDVVIDSFDDMGLKDDLLVRLGAVSAAGGERSAPGPSVSWSFLPRRSRPGTKNRQLRERNFTIIVPRCVFTVPDWVSGFGCLGIGRSELL